MVVAGTGCNSKCQLNGGRDQQGTGERGGEAIHIPPGPGSAAGAVVIATAGPNAGFLGRGLALPVGRSFFFIFETDHHDKHCLLFPLPSPPRTSPPLLFQLPPRAGAAIASAPAYRPVWQRTPLPPLPPLHRHRCCCQHCKKHCRAGSKRDCSSATPCQSGLVPN